MNDRLRQSPILEVIDLHTAKENVYIVFKTSELKNRPILFLWVYLCILKCSLRLCGLLNPGCGS
jgi:hypothetical protein